MMAREKSRRQQKHRGEYQTGADPENSDERAGIFWLGRDAALGAFIAEYPLPLVPMAAILADMFHCHMIPATCIPHRFERAFASFDQERHRSSGRRARSRRPSREEAGEYRRFWNVLQVAVKLAPYGSCRADSGFV
jgi:hypothetical protein